MAAEYTPSAESFGKLLAWLSTNAGEGALRYEEIRRKLIRFFVCRGCVDPEDLADITINRVNRALERPSFQYVGDPIFYFYGVAKNVRLESLRRPSRVREIPVIVDSPQHDDRHYDCLEHCLGMLADGQHKLILDYYDYEPGEKSPRRELLAEQLGIPLNALRIRLHRVRNRLRACVAECMREIS